MMREAIARRAAARRRRATEIGITEGALRKRERLVRKAIVVPEWIGVAIPPPTREETVDHDGA